MGEEITRCSFCAKHRREVARLVAAENHSVAICDECLVVAASKMIGSRINFFKRTYIASKSPERGGMDVLDSDGKTVGKEDVEDEAAKLRKQISELEAENERLRRKLDEALDEVERLDAELRCQVNVGES